MSSPDPFPVVVVGATSLVGHFLLPRLVNAGHDVTAVSRHNAPSAPPAGVAWQRCDVAYEEPRLTPGAVLVHLAPLWLAPPLIRRLGSRRLRRVIAFGSTSRFTKADSTDAGERALAARLATAEAAVSRECAAASLPWTLFRPTLIYGAGLDANVSAIARFIRRFGFFALPGATGGLRQPVHGDDLAAACEAALRLPAQASGAYDLSGGSTVSYREMVVQVFHGLGRRPRIVTLPLPLLRTTIRAAHALGARHLSPAMVDRVQMDMCFDHTEATRDLGYKPRPFAFPG